MDIFGGKKGVFKGNMVEKWTNEPCSGVDEVVNTFWVLTLGYVDDLRRQSHRRCYDPRMMFGI